MAYNAKPIMLSEIMDIGELENYKLHLATYNGVEEPLDVFARSWDEWVGWNEYRGQKNDWNREFIFALIRFYHKEDAWLFGGIFKVLNRYDDWYEVKLTKKYENLIGRLIVKLKQPTRGRAFRLENYFEKMELIEILPESYKGLHFPGYDKINLDFSMLESIIKNELKDWKAALENVKGVYLITDKKQGKHYVGSAYGEGGIWSRFRTYIKTGHGNDKQLKNIVDKEGIDYVKEFFKFAVLEVFSLNVPDQTVIDRETMWKDILMTRDFGLNEN